MKDKEAPAMYLLSSHLRSNAYPHICIGKLKTHLGSVLVFLTLGLSAQENSYGKSVNTQKLPIPNEKSQLFYLQRDPDNNTVIYQLNTTNNEIDADKPVNVYWIRYEEEEERKELNYIQRTLAYGVTHKMLDNGDFELRLAAYKSILLRLTYCEKTQKHEVFAKIKNREAILDRIFVRITGGSMFSPDIAYFELSGRDKNTGEKVMERINPK